MSILGITNRTENWKTARSFAPLFKNADLRLKLAKKLGEPEGTQSDAVHLELFWNGMRDHLHQTRKGKGRLLNECILQDFAKRYERLFPNLREKVKQFKSEEGLSLRVPNHWNYDVCTEVGKTKLGNNLYKTEIDVVLETPKHLFIGEAKGETNFGGRGERGLPHQLIREYIMARILVNRLDSKKDVVFICR